MSAAATLAIRTIKTWDLGVRLFHWLLVASIALAFLSSEEDSILSTWHEPAGWVAAVLIAFRLVWGVVGGEHARFANLIRPSRLKGHVTGLFAGRVHASLGHNPLGGIAVIGLLILAAATMFTGAAGDEDIHEAIAWTLLAMIALHVGAVIAMSFLTRDNLIGAMITGRKKTTHFPHARDATPPGRLAVPLAMLAVAGSGYVAMRIDPNAFAPGVRTEAAESSELEEGGERAHGEDEY
ncbi:MAG: cytochrome b/b6 domain-containing protein [Brevundimonas sp.]|uniref:cytochrome b/b6 domain-containing protein n=1 Tax=Brevundimonas sp. TaxID=1871086 RepID=UPI002489A0A3|nr:cytochrome b/b6 domain-containing protein [Brevundimonas sp.]MDI1325359.1 cytochrome b/b6 domain-containing protein [Brevundimonas sp.]